jgi:hypothetical protein
MHAHNHITSVPITIAKGKKKKKKKKEFFFDDRLTVRTAID